MCTMSFCDIYVIFMMPVSDCFSFESAAAFMSSGDYERAVLCLNKAIKLQPDEASFYVSRADCYLRLADLQSAILNYKKACTLLQDDSLSKNLAVVYYIKAQCLADQGYFVESVDDFLRAADLRPDVDGYRVRW